MMLTFHMVTSAGNGHGLDSLLCTVAMEADSWPRKFPHLTKAQYHNIQGS